MIRWTSEDDMALLIQANNELRFLQKDGVMKAWGVLGKNLLDSPGFSRAAAEIDGKKVSHRFHLLKRVCVYLGHRPRVLITPHSPGRTGGTTCRNNIAMKKGHQEASVAEKSDKVFINLSY